MTPEAALEVSRFLHDSSALLLWGAIAFLWSSVPPELARHAGGGLRTFRVVAIAVVVATTAAALPLETAMIGGAWGDALRPAMVGAVMFETSVGHIWQAEVVATLLLLASLAVPRRARAGATALAAGLVAAGLALGGHAAMQEGWLGLAHRLNNVVHVLSAGAWLGALVVLLPVLGALGTPPHHAAAGTALRRFSAAAPVAVALVLGSGALNTALVLGRWPTDWSSPYQAMLAAKIALVATMVGLALVNRYRFVPRLAQHPVAAARAIRRGTAAELALGAAAIGLVAVFGMLEPG